MRLKIDRAHASIIIPHLTIGAAIAKEAAEDMGKKPPRIFLSVISKFIEGDVKEESISLNKKEQQAMLSMTKCATELVANEGLRASMLLMNKHYGFKLPDSYEYDDMVAVCIGIDMLDFLECVVENDVLKDWVDKRRIASKNVLDKYADDMDRVIRGSDD